MKLISELPQISSLVFELSCVHLLLSVLQVIVLAVDYSARHVFGSVYGVELWDYHQLHEWMMARSWWLYELLELSNYIEFYHDISCGKVNVITIIFGWLIVYKKT